MLGFYLERYSLEHVFSEAPLIVVPAKIAADMGNISLEDFENGFALLESGKAFAHKGFAGCK
jgi:hypothetical protein